MGFTAIDLGHYSRYSFMQSVLYEANDFCPRRTVFVGDYEVAVMCSLSVCLCVCLFVCLKPLIFLEPDFRIL